MSKVLKNISIIALTLIVAFAFTFAASDQAFAASKTKVKVPTKITEYYGNFKSVTTMKYNKRGLVTKETYKSDGPEGDITCTYKYEFYKSGAVKKIKETINHGDGWKDTVTIWLNSNGGITKTKQNYLEAGTAVRKGKVTYYKNSKKIKTLTLTYKDNKEKYYYNKKGLATKSKTYYNGELIQLDTYKYNKKGLLIKHSSDDPSDKYSEGTTQTYKYKYKNGVVKKRNINGSGDRKYQKWKTYKMNKKTMNSIKYATIVDGHWWWKYPSFMWNGLR